METSRFRLRLSPGKDGKIRLTWKCMAYALSLLYISEVVWAEATVSCCKTLPHKHTLRCTNRHVTRLTEDSNFSSLCQIVNFSPLLWRTATPYLCLSLHPLSPPPLLSPSLVCFAWTLTVPKGLFCIQPRVHIRTHKLHTFMHRRGGKNTCLQRICLSNVLSNHVRHFMSGHSFQPEAKQKKGLQQQRATMWFVQLLLLYIIHTL